jgi:hypothetical protein
MTVYFPLNNSDDPNNPSGLYEYNLESGKNKLIFEYDNKYVILGCKIKNNIFYGVESVNNLILIYNFKTKNQDKIYLDQNVGVVNDICCHPTKDIIYFITNTNLGGHNGLVSQINFGLTKKYVHVLIGNHPNALLKMPLVSLSGINIYNNKLFFASLTSVYSYNLSDYILTDLTSDINNKDYPLYDNITFYNNDIYVAVFNYGSYMVKFGLENQYISQIADYILTLFFGSASYADKQRDNGKMTNTYIKFAKINKIDNSYKYYQFSEIISNFDKEITQIGMIYDNLYLLVNYKANSFAVIETEI